MKPIKNSTRQNSKVIFLNLGTGTAIGNIEGTVEYKNELYSNSIVYLFQRSSCRPITWCKTKTDGTYSFLGLNANVEYFVTVFDLNKQHIAVTQDYIVPK